MKRFLCFFLMIATLFTSFSLFGCSTDAPGTPKDPDDPEPPREPDAPGKPSVPYINEENLANLKDVPTDLLDDAAYERATNYNGRANLSLLQSVMNRAKAGEDITVATIGSSITAGSKSSNVQSKSYSARFRNWWSLTFPLAYVKHINAGIGATTSYLGVHRVQEDIIDKETDVCIIEFSVNDYSDNYFKDTYESLIARLLANDIAVILLFMVKQNGTSTQQNNVTSGIKLGVPMISYGDAVMPMIESGELSWTDISPDDIHPNDKGHAMVGELLWEYLNEVYATCPDEVEPTRPRDEVLYQANYFNAYLADSKTLELDTIEGFAPTTVAYSSYANGWTAKDGGVIEFTATFSRMGVMYRKTIDGLSGKCKVFIDDKLVATLEGDYTGGFGDYQRTDQCYSKRGEAQQHTVRLEAEDGKAFTIVRFMLAE